MLLTLIIIFISNVLLSLSYESHIVQNVSWFITGGNFALIIWKLSLIRQPQSDSAEE